MGKKIKTILRISVNFFLIYFISIGFMANYKFNNIYYFMYTDLILIFLTIGIIEFWRIPKNEK